MTNEPKPPGRPSRGTPRGPRPHAVYDPTLRRRRRVGLAILALLLLTPLLAAQAAFGFPLGGLMPDAGSNPPQPHRPSSPDAGRRAAQDGLPPPPKDPTLYLSVPRLGLRGNTVRNDDSELALGKGAIKLPQTGFPWQEGANTYIACHRLGYPGTESYHQCLSLPSMRKGDEIRIEDANGTAYRYKVTETLTVSPDETNVAEPVPGKQVLSLQTCIEAPGDLTTLGPDWAARFVVRADLVERRPPPSS